MASAAVQDFIEQSLSEFTGASAQFEGDDPDTEVFTYTYWKQPNGHIYVGPAWASELKNRRKLGHEPLDHKYGEFQKRTKEWDTTVEPWRAIFRHPEGPAEFSVEQIRDMGWHKKPPYRGVVFPQLEGVEIEEFRCPTCKRGRLWTDEDLRRHESVAHKDVSSSNQLARAIASAQKEGANTEAMTQILSMLAQGQQQMAEAISALAGRLDQVEAAKPEKSK